LSRSGGFLYLGGELKPIQSSIVPILGSILILMGLSALRLTDSALPDRLENVSYDLRVQSAGNAPGVCATNFGLVFVDDNSIAAVKAGLLGRPGFGLYWPRSVYGRLLEEIVAEGADTVAFDVLFGELRPDLHGFIRNGEPIDSDDFLAEQLKLSGNVILACERDLLPADLFATNALALGDITTEKDADGVLRRVKAYRDYPMWHPAFRQVAALPEYGVNLLKARIEPGRVILPRLGLEDIVIPLDEEGRFSLADFGGEALPPGTPEKALPCQTRRVWHMGVVLAARQLGLDLEGADVDLDRGRITLRGDGIERVIPVDSQGRFYIDWSIPINDPRLQQEPALNVLARSVALQTGTLETPPRHWSGKAVVVGSTATGNDLSDTGATPLDPSTFLVSKHWNVANSIVVDRFIHRGTPFQETLILLLAGLVAGICTMQIRPLIALVLTLALAAGYIMVAFALYARFRIWLPLVLPLAATLGVYVVVTTWRVLFEQSERRRVKTVFSKVVSPNVVSELLQARELALGGARREITVFFADVRGFTALTDEAQQAVQATVARLGLSGADAKALVDQQAKETLNTVNLYLALVADVVKRHHGTLDKYIGDCVMAFWGAPTPNPRHALSCVRAAIDAQRAIERVNQDRTRGNASASASDPPLPVLSLGTGINTGEATVGLMGSDAHILNYTVFGREVNVASRLEGVSGRGRIIISRATHQHLLRDDPELAASCVALESTAVKGIREQVAIYEVPWREAVAGAREPAVAG